MGTQTQPASPTAGQGQGGETGQGAAAPADTRPLAGAELITPTLPGGGRSYILPSFSVYEGADSNAFLVPGMRQFETATVPSGTVVLNQQSRNNQIGLSYGAGALIFDSNLSASASFQDFGIQDSYTGRRWSVFLTDRASYLPRPIGGFQGIGFAGAFSGFQGLGLGQAVAPLSPGITPQTTILSGTSGITTNTAIAQAQYSLTSKTSISAMGDLGYVHFSQNSLFSGTNALMVFSADHQMSPRDSISFSYSFMALRYSGGSVAVNNNIWQLGYSHRISERFSMTLLAGPDLTYSAISGVPGVLTRRTWSGRALLGYTQNRTNFTVSYAHYLAPGSGVFQGAETDLLNGSVSRELTRTWSATVSLGYSRNSALGSYSVNPNLANPGRVGYEYGSLRITRVLGRYMQAFAVYNLERQASGQAFVSGGAGRLIFEHVFGIGLEVHPRPIGL
ncbi:MAG TPA: hypothetical protein VL523_04320 [Terriglobia bacterium]|nr:hypothetical protein [Terriglobia bacterium]